MSSGDQIIDGNWVLVYEKDPDRIARLGETVTDFNGREAVIEYGVRPLHSGSSGHVKTSWRYCYAPVYGLKWVFVEARK